MTEGKAKELHAAALRVLAETGVEVEHEALRHRLTSVGGVTDEASGRVRFPAQAVEAALAEAPKAPPHEGRPRISASTGIYQSYYAEPETGELVGFDERKLACYIALAASLAVEDRLWLLGLPFVPPGFSPRHIPLLERLYCWKYGAVNSGSVQLTGLCEPLVELCEARGAQTGRQLEDLFSAVGYLVSPLKLARPECEQMLWFAERGLPMYIGHLPSQGGTAPVTLGGIAVLTLAEQLFLFLLHKAFRPETVWHLSSSIVTVDMRQGAPCYGRPEQQRLSFVFAELGRFYGCAVNCGSGLTDAKAPGFEAGAQKATSAVTAALTCGLGTIQAGLLGLDEICSPVQLLLDDELARALEAQFAELGLDDLDEVVAEIAEAGPGGGHLMTEYTVMNFREALWEPHLWSRQLTSAWLSTGRRTDAEQARDKALAFERAFEPEPLISEAEERELVAIIKKAGR